MQSTREEPGEPVRKENPYLPQLSGILKEILRMRGLSFRDMRLLVVDTDMERASPFRDGDMERAAIFQEEDVEQVLSQLSGDLNFLTIWTKRPAYFWNYVETMYEENGLLVQVGYKESAGRTRANVTLDFEEKGSIWIPPMEAPAIYLPVYKKRWETAENLDICVPIGYNTVIVKGILNEEGCNNGYGKEKYLDV